jgi:hypothetical protein
MKKGLLIIIVLLLVCSFLNAESSVSLNYKLSYSDNAFNLSDDNLDVFDANQAYSYIETSDDMIQTLNIRASHTLRSQNYRFSPALSLTQMIYSSNSDKSNFNLLTGFNARLYRGFIDFRYGWYPQNYTQKYKDSDGTMAYEKFEYEKNLYKMTLKYPVIKKLDIEVYGKYENYYHNEYFTEYDGTALTSGIGLYSRHLPGTLSLYYYFRQYDNKSDNQMAQVIIDTQKDCSYESDIFELKYQLPRLYTKTDFVDYTPYVGFRIENVVYLSEFSILSDPIHASRKDNKIKVNTGTDIHVLKNLNFKLDVIKEIRKVNSEYENLEYSKNYDKLQVSAGISWLFDFNND